MAAAAKGGHTLTPLSKVCRQEVRNAALVVLLRMTGTVMSERDAMVPLKPGQWNFRSNFRQDKITRGKCRETHTGHQKRCGL